MMSDVYTVRHEEQRSIQNTDQVELQAIRSGSAVLDAGFYDERLSGEAEELAAEDIADAELWHQQDVVIDSEVGPIRDEVIRRSGLMKDAYPFELVGNSLVHRPSASGLYEYLLGICLAPSITKRPYVKLPRTFERLAAFLVKSYMGEHSELLHTGAPRDRANGTTFHKAMLRLSELSSEKREWQWSPEPGYPAAPTRTGDEGVDFVVWKTALDSRIGQLYILGQCACGNDWDTKFNDLTLARLEPWFRPMASVPPTRCFALPFLLSDGNFLVAHKSAGWVLDRARLVMIGRAMEGQAAYEAWYPQINQMVELACDVA